MKIILISLLMVLFSGCAFHYTKPGGTEREFYKAKTTCQMQLHQAGIDNNPWEERRYFDECMAGEGWNRT